MNTKEILIAARELIADKSRWTQGTLARNVEGNPEHCVQGKTAVCFCAAGAVMHCATGEDEEEWIGAWSALDAAAFSLYGGRDVAGVNDKLGHEAVLKVYDHAISNCED